MDVCNDSHRDDRHRDFRNKIVDTLAPGATFFSDVLELRAHNPVAARTFEDFHDWSGLSESNTKLVVLKCSGQGAFKDNGFLRAAAPKLECWALYGTRLGREEMESLRAAYVAGLDTPSALDLYACYWDPEAMVELAEFLVSHLKRLRIRSVKVASCDWTQLGKALKLPNCTLQDLPLEFMPDSLDWLADAVRSQHCKLRRLALRRSVELRFTYENFPEELVQVWQSPLEGLEINLFEIKDEEVLVQALKASSSLWFLQISAVEALTSRLVQEGILKLSHLVLSFIDFATSRSISELLGSPDCRLRSCIIRHTWHYEPDPRQLREFQEYILNTLQENYRAGSSAMDVQITRTTLSQSTLPQQPCEG